MRRVHSAHVHPARMRDDPQQEPQHRDRRCVVSINAPGQAGGVSISARIDRAKIGLDAYASNRRCAPRRLPTRSRAVRNRHSLLVRSGQAAYVRWTDVDARNRTLPEWFNRIRSGQIKLPRFQRYEAWGHTEIASLLEAVLRGLPAGAALVLEIGDREPFISRTMVGAPTPTERPNEHLLDGQQRLTAVWRSFHDLYPDRTYLLRLEDDVDHEGEPQIWTVLGQARWYKNDRLYPLWVDDPPELHERDLIPLRLLQPGDVMSMIREWCDRATSDDVHASRDLESQILELRTRVATYNVPYLSLPVGTPKDVALEVFIKMSTSSVRLSAFDVVVAQLEEATGESLHDLVDTLRAKVPSADAYRDPGTWVLDVADYVKTIHRHRRRISGSTSIVYIASGTRSSPASVGLFRSSTRSTYSTEIACHRRCPTDLGSVVRSSAHRPRRARQRAHAHAEVCVACLPHSSVRAVGRLQVAAGLSRAAGSADGWTGRCHVADPR